VGGGAAWRPDGGEIVFVANTPKMHRRGMTSCLRCRWMRNGVGAGPARRLFGGICWTAERSGSLFPWELARLWPWRAWARAYRRSRSLVEGKTPPKIIDLGASVVSGLHTNRKQTGLGNGLGGFGRQAACSCYAPHLGESCSAVNTPETEPANLLSVKPELVHWQNGG